MAKVSSIRLLGAIMAGLTIVFCMFGALFYVVFGDSVASVPSGREPRLASGTLCAMPRASQLMLLLLQLATGVKLLAIWRAGTNVPERAKCW